MGIQAVIAPSFSDIFSGNAFKNGLLTVVLPQEAVDRLMEVAKTDSIHIDLENQVVTTPFQDRFTFEIDPFRKHCLLHGLDEGAVSGPPEPSHHRHRVGEEQPGHQPRRDDRQEQGGSTDLLAHSSPSVAAVGVGRGSHTPLDAASLA